METRDRIIQLAISDLDSSKFTSERAAAKAYNIPQANFARLMNWKLTCQSELCPRLTPSQEKFLAE